MNWLRRLLIRLWPTPPSTPQQPLPAPEQRSPKPPVCIADQICEDHDRDFEDPAKPEVSTWTPEIYRQEYVDLWLTMDHPVFLPQAHTNGRRQTRDTFAWAMGYIRTHQGRYEQCARFLRERMGKSYPWELIAALHMRETGGRFDQNMMNGQALNRVTTWVPKGYGPWSSWEESCIDAFRIKPYPDKWTIANTLYFAERYNGMGYRVESRRRIVGFSPYLWAYSQHYNGGYFVSDGDFRKEGVALGLGVAVILKELGFKGE